MTFNKDFNPGTGNTYQEIHIEYVEHYHTQPVTINHYDDSSSKSSKVVDEHVLLPKKEDLREEILAYVGKTIFFVLSPWKDKYMNLWSDILDLPEVNAIIYDKGRQKNTVFNRKEVCHIIHYIGKEAVDGYGIFEKYNATHIANRFMDDMSNAVRPELYYNPSKPIRDAIDNLLQCKYK